MLQIKAREKKKEANKSNSTGWSKFHPVYEAIVGGVKNISIPKTQLAPAVSLFSFPTRGSHNATSSSPL
jgi:hypothetical protein